MAALAQGTDGGGSVRIPAAFSGVVGFKPSFGRVPSVTRPDAFLWGHPLVHIGPLARTVADAALMTSVMAGPHARRPSHATGRWRRLLARRRKHGADPSGSPSVRIWGISRSISASRASFGEQSRRFDAAAFRSRRGGTGLRGRPRHPGAPLGAPYLGSLRGDRSSLEAGGRRSARRTRGEADAPVPADADRRADNS